MNVLCQQTKAKYMQETNVFFTKIRYGDISSVILLLTSSQSNSRGHASNITCQKLQWSEIEPPQ